MAESSIAVSVSWECERFVRIPADMSVQLYCVRIHTQVSAACSCITQHHFPPSLKTSLSVLHPAHLPEPPKCRHGGPLPRHCMFGHQHEGRWPQDAGGHH